MRWRGAAMCVSLFLFLPNGFAIADPAASSFEVAPTTLDLVPGKPGLFYIANRGGAPVSIQIQTMDWHQNGNADLLVPSDTLYASPPLVQIAPGERQTVRLLADIPDGAREGDYRLIVSQLPQGEIGGTAVRVLLQFSIPVFVSGRAPSPPHVAWSAARQSGTLQISARNDGGEAVKLTNIRMASPGAAATPVTSGLAYVLPGATRSWTVPIGGVSSLHLRAHDERSGAALDTDISLQR